MRAVPDAKVCQMEEVVELLLEVELLGGREGKENHPHCGLLWLFLVVVCGGGLLWLFVVVCGGGLLWLFLVVVCGGCLWWWFVVVVFSG